MDKLLRLTDDNGCNIWCPACEQVHHFTLDRWKITVDIENRPTIKPSLDIDDKMIRGGEIGSRCHFIVTNGKIKYISALNGFAGKEVDMVRF